VKVCLKTSGCAYNQADSDALARALEAGSVVLASESEADVLVYNTCSVKQNTQDKLLSSIGRCTKPLVVTGCLSQANPELVLAANSRAVILPIASQGNILRAVESALKKTRATFPPKPAFGVRVHSGVARVRIASGCAGNCTYCLTRLARGKLASRPISEVVEEVREAIALGAVEIQLCGQDAGAYGLDSGSSLGELLDAVNAVPGRFYCRVGMLNPRLADASLWTHYGKEFKFLHAPIQSASDSVLRDMNRPYDYAAFKSVMRSFRRAFPTGMTATDLIVGYPTETEDDFQETLDALAEQRFVVVNVSKYSSRPGTPAARLERLPTKTVKERSTRASALAQKIALEENEARIGKEFDAVVVERGSKGGYIARTTDYFPVVLEGVKLGEFCSVWITGAGRAHLVGRVI